MDDTQLKQNVAINISYYRKKLGMTQGELAERLNYSDKSVSKWERAEGIPDILVLCKLAEIFGISLDDLINDSDPKATDAKREHHKFVPVLSVGIAFLSASVIFFIMKMFVPGVDRVWLSFIYAIPVSFIIMTVFSSLWYNTAAKIISVSGIIWGVFLSLILTFPVTKLLYLLIICAVLEAMVIIWFIMKHRTKR